MAEYKLDFDEYVLTELKSVIYGEGLVKKTYNITLTNKRIIGSKLGALGKYKFAFDKRVSDVKVFNDSAQVRVTTVSGLQTQIDIYLNSEQLSFLMTGAGNKDALQFANELNHVVTGCDADIYSLKEQDSGKKSFFKAMFGAASVEAKRKVNKRVAMRCTSCGASFEAIAGGTAQCPYCGSYVNT